MVGTPYIKYAGYLLLHKWHVFLECCRHRIPWRGLTHELSKFLPSEFLPYAQHFFGKDKAGISEGRDKTGYYNPTKTDDDVFNFACALHVKRNRHHWQWWVLPDDDGGMKVFEMRPSYRKEMLCDWYGAGKAQGSYLNTREWYQKNKQKIYLHPNVKHWVICELDFRYRNRSMQEE